MNERNDEQPLDLDGLYASAAPRASLEERAAADYRATFASRSRHGRILQRAAAAAAAILLFSAGYLTASLRTSTDMASGRSFMLLLWQDSSFIAGSSPERLASEYAAWSRNVAADGIAITGSELADERTIVPPRRSEFRASPSDAFLGGYFIIGADDIAEARLVADGHPHREHGGWIEVVELIDR